MMNKFCIITIKGGDDMSQTVKRIFLAMEHVVQFFEIALSVFVFIGIIYEGIITGGQLLQFSPHGGVQTFQTFLDNALMYIIGLEVAMMLIKREPNIVLDILIFAIARKMIVEMSSGIDFLLGALAIFVLYLVKCYGISCILLPWHFRRGGTTPAVSQDDRPPSA
jgi:uncharacterized membrane protein (DUF373 family)